MRHAADVTIRIYEAADRLIRRLDLGYLPPGIHVGRAAAAHWDGRNGAGEPVGNGVYFAVMTNDEDYDVRRLLLAK